MQINISKLDSIDKTQENRLVEIWEGAVRATHDFLSEDDIQSLKEQVRQAFPAGDTLICASDPQGNILAFLMAGHEKIEMLFVHPDIRGAGLGRKLIEYALKNLDAQYVDVNEQNPQGILFYKHMGFHVINRSSKDPQGNPFPILHMAYRPVRQKPDRRQNQVGSNNNENS